MISSDPDDYLLADLIDLSLVDREAYLSRTCGHDPALRQRLLQKLDQLVDSLSTANDSTSQTPAQSSSSEIAHALSAGLDLLEKLGTTVGHYTLLEKIGEGGCGIVYLAQQHHPVRRQVALKLIKLGLDTREFVARFEAERQALALMEHPNIARVFDAGANDVGRPYFVMELVRGVPITHYCDENCLSLRDRLQLFISICQAVQHAHQKGVIHRDLKPSNVLVAWYDSIPVPKIIDFGIAKAMATRLADKTLFTQFHSFIGTPAYASPEQMDMSGSDVDTRTDVYSLGVLLYELLTGRTPFDSQELARVGLDAMRKSIREIEPPRPSIRVSATEQLELDKIATHRGLEPLKLIHHLRGDLDWIVMKCLEKDRTRRYDTASGIAADLNRHLNNEPVEACPPTSAYRFQKWVRRNKLTFVASGAVSLALMLGIVVSTWQAVRATHAEQEARAAQTREAAARARAQAQELVARQRAYASDINVAMEALRGNNLGRAIDLLDRQRPHSGESDLRGWEWRYLWQQTRSDALSVLCEKTKMESLAVSADGRWLAIGIMHKDGLFVWDLHTRKEVAHLARGKDDVRAVFSPTEPLLAFTTGGDNPSVCLWSATTRQMVNELPLEGHYANLAFSQDGRTLVTSTASSGPTGHVTLWRANNGDPLANYTIEHYGETPHTSFAVAPDSSVAAYGSMDRVRVVDLRNGKERWTAVASQNFITALAFSPDGTMLATAAGFAESDIRLWEVSTGKEIGRLEGHTSWVGSLVFWPGGKKLASSSADQTIRTWDLASRICTDVLRGHRQEVWRLALLPDNRTLVSGCKDGVVCLWDTSVTHQRKEAISWSAISAWCFAPDSQSVLTLDTDRQVALWSGTNFQKKEPLLTVGIGGFGYDLFARDGRFVACAAPDGNVSVWDLSSRTLSSTFKPAGKNVLPIKFHVDGTRLLVWSLNDSRLRDWDLAADREVQSWSVQRETMRFGWDLSRDQHQLAMAPLSGKVSIRNLAEKSTLNPNLDILEVGSVAFAPSGKMLAMTSLLGYVRVWETGSWREIATLRGYLHGVYSLAFSPDGHRLVTAASAEAEALKFWAVESWQEVLSLQAEGHQFLGAAFSPDGNAVGAMTTHGLMHIWRAPTWDEIEKAEAHGNNSKPP